MLNNIICIGYEYERTKNNFNAIMFCYMLLFRKRSNSIHLPNLMVYDTPD